MRRKKVSRKIPVRAHKRRVTSKMRIRRKVSRKGSRKVRMRGKGYQGLHGQKARNRWMDFNGGPPAWYALPQEKKDEIMS